MSYLSIDDKVDWCTTVVDGEAPRLESSGGVDSSQDSPGHSMQLDRCVPRRVAWGAQVELVQRVLQRAVQVHLSYHI